MPEFCQRCSELETEIELLKQQHYKEMQCMKTKIQDHNAYAYKLRDENERLCLDLAFYDKRVITK